MSVLVGLVILLCVVVAAWSWLRKDPNGVPDMPGALPILGHSLQVIGDRTHLWKYVVDMQIFSVQKAEGVSRIWFGTHSIYVITDPDDSITVSNACLNKPFFYDFAREFLDNGLITAEAPIWKIHRKLINPAFNLQVLNTYVHEINVQAQNLACQLASKAGTGPFDLRKFFIDFTMTTVTRTSLGLNNQDQAQIDTEYAESTEDYLALVCDRFQKVWLHCSYIFEWSEMKRKQTKLVKKLNDIINPIIRKRKSESNKNSNTYDDTPGKFKPVLDRLLQMAEEQAVFTDDDIRQHLDTLVVAAYDTTSSALSIILLVIASDKGLQERLFKEIQEVLIHEDDDLTKDDLPKLMFLEAVIKESMRMYPPVPLCGRKIDVDVKLKKRTLRAGNSCIVGLYGLLRHPMWGPDAEQFRPERWLDPANLPQHPSLQAAAFGVGKRNCIGKQYSMMVMKTALAHIIRRYYVTGNINTLVCEFDVVSKPVQGHHIGLTLRT